MEVVNSLQFERLGDIVDSSQRDDLHIVGAIVADDLAQLLEQFFVQSGIEIIAKVASKDDLKNALADARALLDNKKSVIVIVPNARHADLVLNYMLNGQSRQDDLAFPKEELIEFLKECAFSAQPVGLIDVPIGGLLSSLDTSLIAPELLMFIESLPDAHPAFWCAHAKIAGATNSNVGISTHSTSPASSLSSSSSSSERLAQSWHESVGGLLEQQRSNCVRQEKYIADLERQVNERTKQLNEVLNSGGWRFVTRLCNTREMFLPRESRRRALADFALKSTITRSIQINGKPNSHFKELVAKFKLPLDPIQQLEEDLKRFLQGKSAKLVFPKHSNPQISVLIPTFNKAGYLYACLRSLLAQTDYDVSYEVIVVDDASTDETAKVLERVENITHIKNAKNLEYLRSCNKGALSARGKYLLMLNNDVEVKPLLLQSLLQTIEAYPNAGAVGGKLLRFDGSLQEAGSIVFADGTTFGYGRGDDPNKPEYNYLREVDFCSAACLLVRMDLFRQVHGYDELYAPAYYEDVDLCFAIKQAGYKIVYQPEAQVLHREYGSRPQSRAVELMLKNQEKFSRKFECELAELKGEKEILKRRDVRSGKRVLVIDDMIPDPSFGAGFPRAYKMIEALVELGCLVTFAPSRDRHGYQPITGELQNKGVEVVYGELFSPTEFLSQRPHFYDVVVVSRPTNAPIFLSLAQRYQPQALLVYDAEALFVMREILQAELEERPLTDLQKRLLVNDELQHMRLADVVVTVSGPERDLVLANRAHKDVRVWGHVLSANKPNSSFDARENLLFVGAGNGPNVDGIRHFVKEVFPLVLESNPQCRLLIAGARLPDSVLELNGGNIDVLGFVGDLDELYEKAKLFVVPLRYGAGISLKLLEAMARGLPTVISPLAGHGLDLVNGQQSMIAESACDFAKAISDLYNDRLSWNQIQTQGLQYVEEHYSEKRMRDSLAEIISKEKRIRGWQQLEKIVTSTSQPVPVK